MFSHYKTSTSASLRVRLLDLAFIPVAGVAQASVTVTLVAPNATVSTLTPVTHFTWSEITTGAFSGAGVYNLTIDAGRLGSAGEYTVAVSGGGGQVVAEFSVHGALPADNYTRLGSPSVSVSADIAAIKSDTGSTLTQATTAATNTGTINTKLGTPAGVSVSADVAAIKSDTGSGLSQATTAATQATNAANTSTSINTKLGTPAGVSVSADIADVSSDIATLQADLTLVKKYQEGSWKIETAGIDANRLIIYDTNGTTPLIKFNLQDSVGQATTVSPFRRIKVP